MPAAHRLLLLVAVLAAACTPAVALAVSQPASVRPACAALTLRQATAALGAVYRFSLEERYLGSVRMCSVLFKPVGAMQRAPYVTVHDWPAGGARRAFDYTTRIFRRRKQPKGVRFVSFTPVLGLGREAYRSEVIVNGHPRKSFLVWTGRTFVRVFNNQDAVTFAQLLSLTRSALDRV
jgi:hypothetical protein